jgi:hypothetical protein
MIGALEKTVFDCPDPQVHVDIRVPDVEAATGEVLALGARRLSRAPERGFRVFADPAGHPFCLVFGGAAGKAQDNKGR